MRTSGHSMSFPVICTRIWQGRKGQLGCRAATQCCGVGKLAFILGLMMSVINTKKATPEFKLIMQALLRRSKIPCFLKIKKINEELGLYSEDAKSTWFSKFSYLYQS